jgi:transcriptional regulator with XRE-family HTH domain
VDLDLVNALAALDPAVAGRRLKEARIAAGLTQPQVCGDASSVGYLSRLERGERRVGPELLERLCANIGISPELVIRGVEAPDPRRWECELDFAELELATGEAAAARDRTATLLSSNDLTGHARHLERARLVAAKANASCGDQAAAMAGFDEVVSARATKTGWLDAVAGLARLLRETGDLARSIKVSEDALDSLDQSAPDREAAVRIAMNLAAAIYETGDVDRALALCRQTVAAAEKAGSAVSRAAAYWNTAIIACEAGDLDEALILTRRALAIFADVEDARLEARLRTQLGIFLLRSEPPQTDEALKHLTAAKVAYDHSEADIADILHNRMALARGHFAAGDINLAEEQAARALTEAGSFPFVAATARTLLGRIARVHDNPEAARSHLVAAVQDLTAAGADRRAAQQWFTLASLFDEMGLPEDAKDAYRRAAVSTGLTQSYGTEYSNGRARI